MKTMIIGGYFLLYGTAVASSGAHNGGGEDSGDTPPVGDGLRNPLNFETIPEVLSRVAGFLFSVAIPIVTIMILYGAFQLLTAGGSDDRVTKGRKTITWAVIGLVVVLVAGGIATLVESILTGAVVNGNS